MADWTPTQLRRLRFAIYFGHLAVVLLAGVWLFVGDGAGYAFFVAAASSLLGQLGLRRIDRVSRGETHVSPLR